ncbi:DUF3883 domain-containing protein [Cinnamomum micranthum f. kanehirae]|uniref:DUF3883 domain-containing protein n=1 Tax=Cinnamomum micranthum f. kanehirae TaxID=337451 RepID=A0A3S3NVA2_9MAGN|nr:DUF3883 domain-containing protein [Cinnamomum micranthum f. kanehirae]
MHGPRRPFRPRAAAPPPPPRQNPNPYVYFQASVPFYRNPFHLFPNPNLSATHLPQNPFIQNPGFHPPPSPQIRPTPPNNREETLEKIERAVGNVNRDLLAAGEGISAYKVSQSALLALEADSFGSLGFQLQEIPSLYRLIAIESKVNAFINCFVGVRMITSLHDLDIAICKNQGVDRFEDLGMGPLLRNPLVEHYFSVPKDATEIFKISSEDIITSLVDYMHICPGPEIRVEDFLNFIAKQKSVAVRERLGIRIRSLGMHITFIRVAKKAEKLTLKRHLRAFKHTSDSIVSEKQVLDGRFNSISERMKLFSFVHEGKHIRFESSSSEDDNEHDVDNREDGGNANDSKGWCLNSSQNKKNNDQRLSSCPYPSASEEMLRLGLKIDMDGQASPASVGLKEGEGRKSSGKKRKVEYQGSNPSIYKLQKTDKEKESVQVLHTVVRNPSEVSKDKSQPGDTGNDDQEDSCDLKLTSDDIGKFITMWKETCREHTVGEVFDKMLKFYKLTKGSRKLKLIFSSYPGIGLLNIAVTAIRRGMWDSLYDTFQAIGEIGSDDPSSTPYTEIMDVGPSSKRGSVSSNSDDIPILSQSITVDDIIKKITTYFDINHVMPRGGKLHLKDQISSFRKFRDCEEWLTQKFSAKVFGSLGYRDFIAFLEKHASMFPYEFHEGMTGDLEVSIVQLQLRELLSQALSALGKNVVTNKQQISAIIRKQFPLISFQLRGSDPDEDFLDLISRQKSSDVSRRVMFSVTLLGMRYNGCSVVQNASHLSEVSEMNTELGQTSGCLGSISDKDAIECLLKAPMLSDLRSWSHWDIIFAPSLGPLLEWLLNGFHGKELSCIVTSDGKLIRIESSATVDEFLEAALQGSSFHTALKLLSMLSLYGGMSNVPLSLLKCYARQAFEVIIKNSMTSGVKINGVPLMHGKELGGPMVKARGFDSDPHSFGTLDTVAIADYTTNNELPDTLYITNKSIGVASKFVLDCVAYLPSEFRSFAMDVLLAGLRSFTKDAPAVILRECNLPEQRIMLHDVGFCLGILEWVDDYHAFNSVAATGTEIMSKTSETLDPVFSMELKHAVTSTDNSLTTDGKMATLEARPNLLDAHHETFIEVQAGKVSYEVSGEMPGDSCVPLSLEDNQLQEDASRIIESIRREEFGLDPNLKFAESNLLKKQHARLGRALHCLSQELYSQDSHFLLELVQNADDNMYPENVEPALVFILQSTGVVVLNNEQGFSARNIRALCDVGNSTKKGSNTGYIGQKGIGFKSVFRVTDAPEIHSNGFHVKFDASEGQIGLVLPTVVSPCDINFFTRQLSGEVDQTDSKSWNTCIVLPFRSKFKEGTGMSSIMSMFSDLHPSLLLFLHRLRCIKFRNMLDDSLTVMRKEILGDGIVKVSHGKDKMLWLMASQNLRASTIRPDVQTTEIAIAFTLQESNEGGYKPHLEQQPVFSFLPLRTYGLKFILQGDFILPSSREEVDGDSAWNQWLLSEFPALFVSAERSFCALPCFRENPGKAVTVYMSFVPLVGEVHGFFSRLPHMIISKLRMSNCLLIEGRNMQWVPPCRVLRGWTEQAHTLLPEDLLHQHLGVGYMNKDIILADPLAKALGIQDYGPDVLVKFISSMCHTNDGIKSMGLEWLSSWLDALYTTLSVQSSVHHPSLNSGIESDLIKSLGKIPFIPLSDGSFGSLAEGPIWLTCDAFNSEAEHSSKDFPNLYAKLRTVNPVILSAATVGSNSNEDTRVESVKQMLLRIGVQRLSAHEIIKIHILPAMSNYVVTCKDNHLMTEYLCFVMFHLHTTCPSCSFEREEVISELRNKAFVLTNYGYKHPSEVSIHFSKEFGNAIDISKLIDDNDVEWHVLDTIYLKHPSTQSLSSSLIKWREFFERLGVTDFVRVIHIEKKVADVLHNVFQNMKSDGDHSSTELIIEDWESPELISFLSSLSLIKHREKCKYLLEVLDKMWDNYFSEKVNGSCIFDSNENYKPVDSSFVRSIHEYRWIASSIDEELHYPKDLFYDCEAVRSVLGAFAPYAVPQVKSKKFLNDIRFKTQVTLDDALMVLQYWKTCETTFRASCFFTSGI